MLTALNECPLFLAAEIEFHSEAVTYFPAGLGLLAPAHLRDVGHRRRSDLIFWLAHIELSRSGKAAPAAGVEISSL
ncbi:hypothetical protein D3C84_1208060 [compost metagenome]